MPGSARRLHLTPATWSFEGARYTVLPTARLMLAAAALLLLLAAANVANLLFAAATERRRELAVRAALGAAPARLVRLLVAENLLLAAGAGSLALVLAGPGGAWVGSFFAAPSVLGHFEAPVMRVDIRVFLFGFAAALGAGLVAGLLPALGAARRGLVPALKEGEEVARGPLGRRLGARGVLVVVQVALSVVLLVVAGLVLRTLERTSGLDPGFDTAPLLAVNLSIAAKSAPEDEGRRFLQQIVERFQTASGVTAAALTRYVPLSGFSGSRGLAIDGAEEPVRVAINIVGPRYLEALGLDPRHGRALGATDDAGAPGAVMVNEAFVRRYLDGREPLGRPVRTVDDERRFEIVGVVADSRFVDIKEEPEPLVYFSYLQQPLRARNAILVRTAAAPQAVVPALRARLFELDPDLALLAVLPLDTLVDGALYSERMNAQIFRPSRCSAC